MISASPVVTDAGRELLLRSMSGERITFTRFAIGSGTLPAGRAETDADKLQREVLSFGISTIDYNTEENYVTMTGHFDNASISGSVKWTELGVYAVGEKRQLFLCDGEVTAFTLADHPACIHAAMVAGTAVEYAYDVQTGCVTLTAPPPMGAVLTLFYPDGTELLYAYANAGSNYSMISGGQSAVTAEQWLTLIVAVGSTENVTAIVGETAIYVTKREFENHLTNHNNPHHVTAADVGLDKVENAPLTELIPTFTEPPNDATLVSGETFGKLLGKIARVVRSAIRHMTNKENPHEVKATQLDGILPVEHGGTGVGTPEELQTLFGSIVVGYYVGDGKQKRLIELGYKPRIVLLADETGMMGDDIKGTCGGIMTDSFPLMAYNHDGHQGSGWINGCYAGQVVDNGFYVGYISNQVRTNWSNHRYIYLIVK